MAGRQRLSPEQAELVGEIRCHRRHLEETQDRLAELVQRAEAIGLQVTLLSDVAGIPRSTFYRRKKGT
jgi:transcriptional regulator of acetoin/glycerol metabolism